MTPSEKELWKLLRQEPGAHFRKQIPVNDRVFDFGDYGARLLIELDGGIHELEEVIENDIAKEKMAEVAGFRVLRFTNAEVWGRREWLLEQVRHILHAPHPLPPPRQGAGEES